MKWIALSLLFFAPFASADDLRTLLHQKDAAKLSRFLKNETEHERASQVCDVQLKTKRIPMHCFVETSAANREWLSKLCERRANDSRDLRELTLAASHASLPQKCREIARERVDDLQYAEVSENPAALLSRELARELARELKDRPRSNQQEARHESDETRASRL